MNILAIAIQFAATKHVDQVDKGGNAYILHPLRVMNRLVSEDEEVQIIAILHDVMEDCGVSTTDLEEIGMSDRVIKGVVACTKRSGESYKDFISRLDGHKDALLVKRADILDNSNLTRLKSITEKDIVRLQKYKKALNTVNEMLSKF